MRFRLLPTVLPLVLSLVACGKTADPAPSGATTGTNVTQDQDPAGQAVSEGQVVTPDGLTLPWRSYGQGETALLFVHGWSCDQTFWREQISAFDGYRVVTMDLGGHGLADGDRERWRVTGFGTDVAAVADALDLQRIVLIGHSMGGPVSLAAAERLGQRVIAVIAIDALHDADARYSAEQSAPMIAAFEADYAAAIGNLFAGMAGGAIDPALRDWIVARGQASRPAVGIGLLEDYATIDFGALFRNAGVPIRAINAAPGGFTPVTQTERNREYADFDAVIIDDVGHFLQLEAPATVNAALRAELERLR